MTNFAAGPSCSARGHARDLRHYDQLPSEIRDRLKVTRTNLCSACIRNMARRDLAATLDWLDRERVYRPALLRRGGRLLQVQVREEELRP